MRRLLSFAIISLLVPLPLAARTFDGAPPSAREIRQEALRRDQKESLLSGTYGADLENLYVNDSYGVHIRYPRDWKAQDLLESNGKITSIALFLSPLSGSGDTAQENINLVVEDVRDEALNPDQYEEAAIAQEQALFDSFTLVSSNDITLDGEAGHDIVFQASFNERSLMFEQAWAHHDGIVYVWTLAAPPETFDDYSRTFRTMLGSFGFNI